METTEHSTCGRCNRPLKTAKSRKEGYGPVCKVKVAADAAKNEQQEANFNDEQQ